MFFFRMLEVLIIVTMAASLFYYWLIAKSFVYNISENKEKSPKQISEF